MKKYLALAVITIVALANILFRNTYVEATIATLVNVNMMTALLIATPFFLVTIVTKIKAKIREKSAKKFSRTSYNMLRIRLLIDIGLSLPEYDRLDSFKLKRGDPLKFLIRDPKWPEKYDRLRGQIETLYSGEEDCDVSAA